MDSKIISASILCLIIFLTGCANQVTVINSDADLVRLGPDVTGHVYVRDAKGNWNLSHNNVTLPEGWYAGPYHPK